jgi:hypothetical protein
MATGVMTVSASGRVHANSVNPASTRINLQPTFDAINAAVEAGNPCLKDGFNLLKEFNDGMNNQQLTQNPDWVKKSLDDAIRTTNACYDNYQALKGLSFPKSLAYFYIVQVNLHMENDLIVYMGYMGQAMADWLQNNGKAGPGNVQDDDTAVVTFYPMQTELVNGFRADVQAAHPNIIVSHYIPALRRKAFRPPPCKRITCPY